MQTSQIRPKLPRLTVTNRDFTQSTNLRRRRQSTTPKIPLQGSTGVVESGMPIYNCPRDYWRRRFNLQREQIYNVKRRLKDVK